MVAVGPTAIVVSVLTIVFIILYRLADKVDKEDEIKRQWKEYYDAQRSIANTGVDTCGNRIFII